MLCQESWNNSQDGAGGGQETLLKLSEDGGEILNLLKFIVRLLDPCCLNPTNLLHTIGNDFYPLHQLSKFLTQPSHKVHSLLTPPGVSEVPRKLRMRAPNVSRSFGLYAFRETSCLQHSPPGSHTALPPGLHALGSWVSSVPVTP